MSNEGLKALKGVLKAYPELVNNVYNDGASGGLQQIGALATDLIKGARLITAPIQYMGHLQDRLTRYFEKVENEVPKNRQVTPPSSLLLPLLEKLKYQDENDLLTELYVELLKRACDKDRENEAHPAFINIIPQLSSDEAVFIYHLASNGRNTGKYFVSETKGGTNRLMNHVLLNDVEQPSSVKKGYTLKSSAIIQNLFPLEALAVQNYTDLYVSHLKSLNLIIEQNSPGIITVNFEGVVGNHRKTIAFYKLTLFGELFAKACIPENIVLT